MKQLKSCKFSKKKIIILIFSGVVTGIYTTNSANACEYILDKSKAQIVVVDDSNQLEKIKQIRGNLPNLISVIEIPKINELLEEKISNEIELEYEGRLKEIHPNQCCTVTFTSGTTGK